MKNITLSAFIASAFLAVSALAADTATAPATSAKATTETTAGSTNAKCADENAYPLITKADLKKVTDDKSAFVIDVNSADSYKETHVPTAIHYGDHKKDFAQVLPKDKNALIVAYCGGPQCTAWFKPAEAACKMGYTNIKHFKEGITGWKKM